MLHLRTWILPTQASKQTNNKQTQPNPTTTTKQKQPQTKQNQIQTNKQEQKATGLLSKVINHMLDHFEGYKDLHNISINVGLPRLLHTAMIDNGIDAMLELSYTCMSLELDIKVLQRLELDIKVLLNKEDTLISKYYCNLKHSN